MSQKPVVRLYLFFATENDRAVILRQGPARQFRMILWHRESDRFEDGQWLKHKVYPERCSLSPDGRHFIYFALDGRWSSKAECAYTALSRPPYWTALALFPEGSTWGGGGFFVDRRHYWASGGADIVGRDEGLFRVELGRQEKGCTTGLRLMNGQRAALDREASRRILAPPRPETACDLFERIAAPQGSAMERYDTMGGRLYRRNGMDLDPIRDFTEMDFAPVRAPYDWRASQGQYDLPDPWHPLDPESHR